MLDCPRVVAGFFANFDHVAGKAFTDGLTTSLGSTGHAHPRNAQSLANVVYNATLTWANPSLVTLEKQMETPLFGTDPVEMGVNDNNKEEILARLRTLRCDGGQGFLLSKAMPVEGLRALLPGVRLWTPSRAAAS